MEYEPNGPFLGVEKGWNPVFNTSDPLGMSPHWLWKKSDQIFAQMPLEFKWQVIDEVRQAPMDHTSGWKIKEYGPLHWYDSKRVPYARRNKPPEKNKWQMFASTQLIDQICAKDPKRRLCRSDLTTYNVYQYLEYCWNKNDFLYRNQRFNCTGLQQDGWNSDFERTYTSKRIMDNYKVMMSHLDTCNAPQSREGADCWLNILRWAMQEELKGYRKYALFQSRTGISNWTLCDWSKDYCFT